MWTVLNPRCLPAKAISTNAFELQIFSHELSMIKKYLVPLFLNESSNSMYEQSYIGQTPVFLSLFAKHRNVAGSVDEKKSSPVLI